MTTVQLQRLVVPLAALLVARKSPAFVEIVISLAALVAQVLQQLVDLLLIPWLLHRPGAARAMLLSFLPLLLERLPGVLIAQVY